jgi:hypothetical protein
MFRLLPPPPEEFALRMDVGVWTEPLLDVEEDLFGAQIALKAHSCAQNVSRYHHCPSDAEPLVWEALTHLLATAAQDWPQWFAWECVGMRGVWANQLTGETAVFVPGVSESLPKPPLEWLGRQFQEDLVLLNAAGVCVGGHVCFPSGWSLAEKIGQPFLAIHAEVPGFVKYLGQSANGLVEHLKPHRPVGRWNWTFPATDTLNLDPVDEAVWGRGRAEVTPENAGQACFLRTERQTLSRLPHTGGILFTIHTYLTPLDTLAADPETRRRLHAHLQSLPPAMIAYRGMTAYLDALLIYLN